MRFIFLFHNCALVRVVRFSKHCFVTIEMDYVVDVTVFDFELRIGSFSSASARFTHSTFDYFAYHMSQAEAAYPMQLD